MTHDRRLAKGVDDTAAEEYPSIAFVATALCRVQNIDPLVRADSSNSFRNRNETQTTECKMRRHLSCFYFVAPA